MQKEQARVNNQPRAGSSDVGAAISSRTRLLPLRKQPRTRVPLSILDATVVRFGPTAAAWVYEETRSVDRLRQALQTVVDRYPAWTGQLRFSHGEGDSRHDHTRRHGRLELVYGCDDTGEGAASPDPGIELIIAHSSVPLVGRLPDRVAGVFDAVDGVAPDELIDKATPLAPGSMEADEQSVKPLVLPAVYIQVTTFEGGGIAIAIKIAHPLADAKAMIDFMKSWSEAYVALEQGWSSAKERIAFDPGALDRTAAGNLDTPASVPALTDLASELPIARYDWWASADGSPPWAAQAVTVPPELDRAAIGPLGRPLPWAEWDGGRPCGQKTVFFAAEEVHGFWQAAVHDLTSSSPSLSVRLSHLDTLIAHVWTLVCRARATSEGETELRSSPSTSRLYYTLDARSRLGPPALPPSFVGSPILLAEVATPTASLLDPRRGGTSALAQQIRSTLAMFDPAHMGAHLHALGHASSGQRTWDAFLGVGHGIFTSWTRQAVYGIGFGKGGPPAWVGPVMPIMDGILQVTELGTGATTGGGDWWNCGVAVSISLEQGALERLVADETALRGRPDGTGSG